jgi:hypothetical protein
MINKLDDILDGNKEFAKLVDLINYQSEEDSEKVTVLEKMLIVLLVTKLEVFLENSTSEWFEFMKKDTTNTSFNLSDQIKKEIIKNTISDVYDELKDGRISKRNKSKINNFNILIDDFFPLEKIDIQFKITLNSHGSSEIISLLRKIGIENIFDSMEQYQNKKNTKASFGNIDLTIQLDYEGNINKLINYRNKIIHEDYSINISSNDINEFIDSVNLLSNIVKNHIRKFNITTNGELINVVGIV